ncbi:MAG TPA: NADP-dependent malic enzyme [Oscillospiraceae bacterium]|nr:NADP-dependent malic enzyme [Oscillospiraceae bacterium]HPK36430.1 NADP-dependent malic enzyme [Oscillospiraceae bacterium]HPR76385.1 NADP-dependent malic enzyme [Oscillospiraceae bacterium]
MTESKNALEKHYEWKGKIEVVSRVKLDGRESLSLAYTPGVADACKQIEKDPESGFDLTRRWNMVAVITDGTAVLGLGDIGPRASMPVMEGKCALFKEFGGVDAFPICIDSKDPDEIVRTVKLISYSFGGVNLEDISAPRCFEIEKRLRECCDIPIFHDDQHGTAVVAGAALINACKLTGRKLSKLKAVFSGAGAAACAVAEFFEGLGVADIIICNSKGIITEDGMKDEHRKALAARTNPRGIKGGLKDALVGADVFIGLSVANLVTKEDIKTMAKAPIVFAMANPVPEIAPEDALEAGASVVGTGRSDYYNQINNVLAFPGIFKGALSVRATDITPAMKRAAAQAIADFTGDITKERIIPGAFEQGLGEAVAKAVAEAAIEDGVAKAVTK